MSQLGHPRLNKMLYSIIAFMKCIEYYKNYLKDDPEYKLTGNLKQVLNRADTNNAAFIRECERNLSGEERAKFQIEWKGDILQFDSLLQMFTSMNNEQRATLELFAEELLKGNVKVEMDGGE